MAREVEIGKSAAAVGVGFRLRCPRDIVHDTKRLARIPGAGPERGGEAVRYQGLVACLYGLCPGVSRFPSFSSGSKVTRRVGLIAMALLMFSLSAVHPADGGDLGYSVLPQTDYIKWDKNIGLEDGFLYGGSIGADLDRFVALRAYFLTNPTVSTDLAGVSAQFIDQDLRLTNYGADVILNLNQGWIVPFLKFGGGILMFDPDSGDAFEQIALRAGGGLRYQIAPSLYGEVTVEDLFYRIDRTALSAHSADQMFTSDPSRNKLRSNLAVSARLGVNLRGGGGRGADGRGRAVRQGLGDRLIGGTWIIEPYSGRLRFDDPSGLGDHEIVGGRLGANLSDNLILSGYYWRGMRKGYETTEDLQSYGGEAEFLLGGGRGAVPYLLMGAGKLDFMSDFRDTDGRQRSDKALLILGAGVGFLVNDYLRLNVGARDYILSESDLDDVGSPDELRHSLAVTGGLSFIIGGTRGAGPRGAGPRATLAQAGPEQGAGVALAPAPSRAVWPGEAGGPEEAAAEGVASMAAPAPAPLPPVPSAAAAYGAAPAYEAGKNIVIPAPAVGEIYVRYGEPGAVSVITGLAVVPAVPGVSGVPVPPGTVGAPGAVAPSGAQLGIQDREALRKVIDEEIVAALRASGAAARPEGTPAQPDQADLIAQRIADSIEQRLSAAAQAQPTTIVIERPQEAAPPAVPAPQPEVVTPSAGVPDSTALALAAPGRTPVAGRAVAPGLSRSSKAYTFTGINLDDPVQWLVGARFDAAPIRRGSRIWIVPEVEFGLFNKGSLMLVANAQYDFDASVNIHGTRITPYMYAGAGLLHFGKGVGRDRNEAVLNLGYGVTFDIRKLNAYVEHQGVDLFSLHRLILGLRWAAPRSIQ